MTTTTYSNGQVLTSTALTLAQINAIIQPLTCNSIGGNPPDYSQVRIDWPTAGQPFTGSPSTDICFMSCVTTNVAYNQVRDKSRSGTNPVTETYVYTRGWKVSWVFYGPNSTDRARALRSSIVFMNYFADQLSLSNLYPLPDPTEPVRAPELINAQWFERVDFSVEMYEEVTETIQSAAVTSVELKLNTELGQVADVITTS